MPYSRDHEVRKSPQLLASLRSNTFHAKCHSSLAELPRYGIFKFEPVILANSSTGFLEETQIEIVGIDSGWIDGVCDSARAPTYLRWSLDGAAGKVVPSRIVHSFTIAFLHQSTPPPMISSVPSFFMLFNSLCRGDIQRSRTVEKKCAPTTSPPGEGPLEMKGVSVSSLPT